MQLFQNSIFKHEEGEGLKSKISVPQAFTPSNQFVKSSNLFRIPNIFIELSKKEGKVEETRFQYMREVIIAYSLWSLVDVALDINALIAYHDAGFDGFLFLGESDWSFFWFEFEFPIEKLIFVFQNCKICGELNNFLSFKNCI